MRDTEYSDVKNMLQRANIILSDNTIEHPEFEGIADDIEILIRKITKEVYG